MSDDGDARALFLTLDPGDLAAVVLWGEARGESSRGREAIGCVMQNRVAEGRFGGHDLRRVLLKPWQFSSLIPEGGAANYQTVVDVAHTVQKIRTVERGGKIIGVKPELGPVMRDCLRIGSLVEKAALEDFTGAANHYLELSLLEAKPPTWTNGLKPTLIVGRHAFFRVR